jgi:hypothetical protein
VPEDPTVVTSLGRAPGRPASRPPCRVLGALDASCGCFGLCGECRNRSCESTVTIEYLRALHAAYETFLHDIARVIPVIRVDYSMFRTAEVRSAPGVCLAPCVGWAAVVWVCCALPVYCALRYPLAVAPFPVTVSCTVRVPPPPAPAHLFHLAHRTGHDGRTASSGNGGPYHGGSVASVSRGCSEGKGAGPSYAESYYVTGALFMDAIS